MSTRSERDRQKALQEKHQAILAKLLKDDDNKYCVDCDAKGVSICSDHNINNFFVKTPLNYTFFKRSWHH